MELKDKVKLLREQRGMKQEDLAKATGLAQTTISRLENGRIEDPRGAMYKKLATALNTTTDYLTGRTLALSIDDHVRVHPAARDIVESYARLNVYGRAMVRAFVEFILERPKSGTKKSKSVIHPRDLDWASILMIDDDVVTSDLREDDNENAANESE